MYFTLKRTHRKTILAPLRPIIIGFGLMIRCLLVLFRIAEVNFIQGDVKQGVIVAMQP
jgi:hypothetical protein